MANVSEPRRHDGESRNSLREALLLLGRLMRGERLSVRGLLGAGEVPSDSTGRRYFSLLEELIPGVQRVPHSRPAEWVYVAPEVQQADRSMLLALGVAQRLFVFVRGSGLDQHLAELAAEVGGRLGPDAAPVDVSRAVHTTLRAPGVQPDIVDRVTDAISEKTRAEAVYENFEGLSRDVILEPYTLVFSVSGVHCYAKCLSSMKAEHIASRRIYNLARFRSFRATGEHFEYPAGYDPARVFQHCFGIILPHDQDAEPAEVVLRFAGRWGHYLRTTPWHPTQSEPRRLGNGKFEITLHVHLTFDLVHWIRGHGKDITVVKPSSLRRAVTSGEPPSGE